MGRLLRLVVRLGFVAGIAYAIKRYLESQARPQGADAPGWNPVAPPATPAATEPPVKKAPAKKAPAKKAPAKKAAPQKAAAKQAPAKKAAAKKLAPRPTQPPEGTSP
jgi:hypothetical protein